MRSITVIALLLATLVLVSCGDNTVSETASLAASITAVATTQTQAPDTSEDTTTSQPATTTTQAPTTTSTAPPITTQAPPTTTDMTLASDAGANAGSELPDVVERYIQALLDGDASALAELFTYNGVMTGVVESHQRASMSPPSVIRSRMGSWFRFVDNIDVEHEYVIAEGDTVVLVSIWSGLSSTHARGGADPTPFSGPNVTVLRLENGLIRRADVYYEYDQIVN